MLFQKKNARRVESEDVSKSERYYTEMAFKLFGYFWNVVLILIWNALKNAFAGRGKKLDLSNDSSTGEDSSRMKDGRMNYF